MPTATITEAGLRNVFTNVDFIGAAVSTMLAYEYFITLGDEVKYFWKRRSLGPSALFYMNRYLNLVLSIYQLIVLNPAYHRSPERFMPTLFVLEVLGSFPWGAFSALRAYALSRNMPLSILIFLLSMVPIVMNLVCFKYGLGGYTVPIVSCVGYNGIPPDLSRKCLYDIYARVILTITTRTCAILADLLLVIITWTRLFKQRKLGLGTSSRKFSLTDVLLRDGTIYFLIMLLLNCLHIAFTVVSIFIVSSLQHLSCISIFVPPLTAILVSRFMIHLQAADRQLRYRGFGTDAQASRIEGDIRVTESLIFDRVIGSLRCELEPEDLMGSKGGTGSMSESEKHSLGERAALSTEDAPCGSDEEMRRE
ncbi:hypothetical protein LXA43DRAFT_1094224 [Ganoderma leucocontextum]|nr:hypothetical protein LXA43DRAFT_1094224 [Ganoderma leucocontextum]